MKEQRIHISRASSPFGESANNARFFTFYFDVPAQPKERPNKWGKTRPSTRAFEQVIAAMAKEQWGGQEPLTDFLRVEFKIYQNKRRGDYDNLMKSITDAMQGIVFKDDKQIDIVNFSRSVVPNISDSFIVTLWRADW
jgi:Holliday junction resolvase RusA-like endonuclease